MFIEQKNDGFRRLESQCHFWMSKVKQWEDRQEATDELEIHPTWGDVRSGTWLEHFGTFHVPAATRNKDLRRGELARARWAMLENKDLHRRKFTSGANVPKNVPAMQGHPIAAMLRIAGRPTRRLEPTGT